MKRPASAAAWWISPNCCCAPIELLRDNQSLAAHYRTRFTHVLVDEFQDTNAIQYAWTRLMAGQNGNPFVVGDDDQSIYRWRGAKVENLQQFTRDYPDAQMFKLEQNYRSTGNILGAANALIAHNSGRLGKNLWTSGSKGERIHLYAAFNERDEADFVVARIAEWVAPGRRAQGSGHPLSLQCAVARLRRSRCCPRAFPTRSTAACASTNAPRSRMRWPTCG